MDWNGLPPTEQQNDYARDRDSALRSREHDILEMERFKASPRYKLFLDTFKTEKESNNGGMMWEAKQKIKQQMLGGSAGVGVQVGPGGQQVTGQAGWNGQNGNIQGMIGFGSGGFSIGFGGGFRFAKDGKEKTIYVDAIETSEGTFILPTYTKGKFDNFKSCLDAGAVTID